MRAWTFVVSFFVLLSAHSLELQFSQNYFDPERVGESQWTKVDSLKNPAAQINLGRIKVASLEVRYFKIRIVNNSTSAKQISFSALPAGFKWKENPPTQLTGNQKLELGLELESSAIGKKFTDIQVRVADENAPHVLRIMFEVKE